MSNIHGLNSGNNNNANNNNDMGGMNDQSSIGMGGMTPNEMRRMSIIDFLKKIFPELKLYSATLLLAATYLIFQIGLVIYDFCPGTFFDLISPSTMCTASSYDFFTLNTEVYSSLHLYKLFTFQFISPNILQLMMNVIFMILLGQQLEFVFKIGSGTMLIIFLFGSIAISNVILLAFGNSTSTLVLMNSNCSSYLVQGAIIGQVRMQWETIPPQLRQFLMCFFIMFMVFTVFGGYGSNNQGQILLSLFIAILNGFALTIVFKSKDDNLKYPLMIAEAVMILGILIQFIIQLKLIK